MIDAPERRQKIENPLSIGLFVDFISHNSTSGLCREPWELTHSRNVDEILLISVQLCLRHILSMIQRRLQYSKTF